MSEGDFDSVSAMTRDDLEDHALWLRRRLNTISGMQRQQLVDGREAMRLALQTAIDLLAETSNYLGPFDHPLIVGKLSKAIGELWQVVKI